MLQQTAMANADSEGVSSKIQYFDGLSQESRNKSNSGKRSTKTQKNLSFSGEDMRARVLNYDPQMIEFGPGYRPSRISIRLFGRMGHGKSTFVNNCLCIMNKKPYKNVAGEIPQGSGSATVCLTPFQLTKHIEIVDNKGISLFDSNEIHEFNMQLCGVRKTGTRVQSVGWWSWSLDQGRTQSSEWQNTLYVPILIYRADFPITSDKESLQRFVENCYNYTGLYPIIVLMAGNRLTLQFSSIRAFFGNLHCTKVFLLNNYHEKETQRNPETDTNVLEIIASCLDASNNVIKLIQPNCTKPTSFY